MGCSCSWQRSLHESCETNTGATEEVLAPNLSWRGCNHLTSNCSVHENHRTYRTFPMARPKCLMRDFMNLNRIHKAHRTNVWWIMKVFRVYWNWPYRGQQIPYLVPRTANRLSPLWSNTDHWPYAAGVCIVIRTLHDCPSQMNENLLISNSKLTSDSELIWWR